MIEEPRIDCNYIDNYGVKKYVTDGLIDKYFGDINPDLRTVGMIGYTTELISNISEDALNTLSLLYRESFPNQAKLTDSIYSYASLFKFDNIFSSAALCKFLLILEEKSIIQCMEASKGGNNNSFFFYIDKNTVMAVEDIPYSLDYDIEITILKKTNNNDVRYEFIARYMTEEYNNSLSDINNQYINIRRSSNGFLALEVNAHQYEREVIHENIINTDIKQTIIDVEFEDQIAGFDVLYKSPSSAKYVNLVKLLDYSQPIKNPFCYYQLFDNGKIRLSFNTQDLYFIPESNSELSIILYKTKGDEGNFDSYEGNEISVIIGEKYQYPLNYITFAKPIGASKGGMKQKSINEIQSLINEMYNTHNALTTENDLQLFFNNYKSRYGGDTNIIFSKKRDDIYERIYSAFMIINNEDYIYKTNTLNLSLNLYDLNNIEEGVFILEPGTLFTSIKDKNKSIDFVRNETLTTRYKQEYTQAVTQRKTNYILDDTEATNAPVYLKRACSFAQFKSRKKYKDITYVWDLKESELNALNNPSESKFIYFNPFLIRFLKSSNITNVYMTYINNIVSLDFINQNQSMFIKFTMYTLYMSRKFSKDKVYEFTCSLSSTLPVDKKFPLIHTDDPDPNAPDKVVYHLNDRFSLKKNDLRVILAIMDTDNNMICYSEMIPSHYDDSNDNITFKASLLTNDHITSNNKLRLIQDTVYRDDNTEEYYREHPTKPDKYVKYDKNNAIISDDVDATVVKPLINNKTLTKYENLVNASNNDNINIDLDKVTVKIFTLYNRNFSNVDGSLELNSITNHPFMEHDTLVGNEYENYNKYIWTNEYATLTHPITFIKYLNSVRCYFEYMDHTASADGINYTYDIMDAEFKLIPFVQANLYHDKDKMNYFFNTFYNNYLFIEDIINNKLRNQTGIDVKFYNTYGKANSFLIGDANEKLNTVNIRLSFDVWFTKGTDTNINIPIIKKYIKKQVENLNNKGLSSLHISNLIRNMENTYAFIDHIIFNNINNYATKYQSITNYTTDINNLNVDERRWYVPEMLVCDIDDITINEFFME